MGTNYYLYKNVCNVCGRGDEPLHIGKSSYGWCFGLHVIPEEGINDFPDWEKLWEKQGTIIKDEYNRVVDPVDMKIIITERRFPIITFEEFVKDPEWYEQNHAEASPNGLARHKIDGDHCIGHGEGTWDLEIGEFS